MIRSVFFVILALALCACATVPTEQPAEKPDSVFYPSLPDDPRVQFLLSINAETDIGFQNKTSALDTFLFGQRETKKLVGRPWDIEHVKGKIYYIDRTYKKIIIVDLENKVFDFIDDRRQGKLFDPTGLCVTSDDIKYVADNGRKQIVTFDANNEYLRAYGGKELFKRPLDVAVHGNFLYVVDMEAHQVQVLDKESGALVNTIGEGGSEEGRFYRPTHVVVDSAGNLFVGDAFNFRVQKFDPQGNFIRQYGQLGDTPGSFGRPKGIAVDREEHLYVADAAFNNVQLFDAATGDLLLILGGVAGSRGNMGLPSGMHVDYDNVQFFKSYVDPEFEVSYLIYVGNMIGTNKLSVYGFGKWTGTPLNGGKTPPAGKEDAGKPAD